MFPALGLNRVRPVIVLFCLVFMLCPVVLGHPVSVRDARNRELVIDTPLNRIACLYAFSGHVITMLGRGRDMVAIVNGLKKDVLLNQIVPGIRKMPVPAKGGVINIEALLKTRPDMVFLKPETAAVQAETNKLERFGLPYFIAGYASMDQQMTIIENMGKAVDRHGKALAYTRYYRDVIKRVRARTARLPESRRVRIYHSVNEPTRTDAPGTLEADWTRAAGVINVSVNQRLHGKGEKHFADIEQIILWNPDIIIVNEDGVAGQILRSKKWASIKAVRHRAVFPIPVGISRWGHPGGLETPLAILWTAKTVYPDLFPDMDLKQEIKYFYHTFFDMDLTREMVSRILANKGMRTGT